jgi:2'-5' RNA ligase
MRDFISPVAKLVEGKAVERRNWHITLAYIGNFPEERIHELHEAKQSIRVEPFRLRFDRLEFWPRPKIAALATPIVPLEMQRLVETVQGAVFAAGIEPEQRTYRPHVTVAKNARPFETLRLAQSAVVEWDRIELVESISEPGGVTYRPVHQ